MVVTTIRKITKTLLCRNSTLVLLFLTLGFLPAQLSSLFLGYIPVQLLFSYTVTTTAS